MDISVYCISHRPKLVQELRELVPDVIHFDGTGAISFSNLVNKCIVNCPTEYIIILSDKARPKPGQIQKLINLVKDPTIAFASMHRFGAFGFHKNLIRTIGFFDERYIPGGFEDDDFILRLREADLKFYETEEIPLISMPGSFGNYVKPYIHFKQKWNFLPEKTLRLLPEINNYDIGPKIGENNWGKWKESKFGVLDWHNRKKYSKPIVYYPFKQISLRNIPPPHETLNHLEIILLLAKWIKPQVYLEFGIRSGHVFHEMIKKFPNTRCIGVDLCVNNKNLGETYEMSTDDFSKKILPQLNCLIDLCFIDADHSHEQSYKDFINIFDYVAEDGLVIFHDTYPINEMYTQSDWCNDAYKTPWKIRHELFKFCELVTLPIQPGLTILRKSNRQLTWNSQYCCNISLLDGSKYN